MTEITIRKAISSNLVELQSISRQTFLETYEGKNTADDMTKYMNENFSLEKLSEELANTNSAFYFASLNNETIGYLKLNFGQSQTDLKDDKSLEIERIYVMKDFHGKRVGQALYETAIKIAKETKLDYLWLGVWVENPKAIDFYKKNGFVEFDKHFFKLGDDIQTDILMKLNIIEE